MQNVFFFKKRNKIKVAQQKIKLSTKCGLFEENQHYKITLRQTILKRIVD